MVTSRSTTCWIALLALCGLLFDPWAAVLSATAGTLASTAVNHWIGAHFGNAISARIPGRVAERIRRIADASDMWSLAGLRLIPVAPFSIVNDGCSGWITAEELASSTRRSTGRPR